jgi:hypothetical protein
MTKIKMYGRDEIQKVYRQFHLNPHSVVCSIDGGYTWSSLSMDTGKWGSGLEPDVYWNMKFAFLETHNKKI